jgi:hypothetical protein
MLGKGYDACHDALRGMVYLNILAPLGLRGITTHVARKLVTPL